MRIEGNKKWLVIAHCMNMDGQAASHHVSDKLPYLRKRGIEPILLSAASGSRDSSYEHHQVFSPAPSGLKFELRHFIRRKAISRTRGELYIFLLNLLVLPVYLLEKIALPLDSQWSWFLSAYLKGKKLTKIHSFECIYVLGGASSAFLAAHLISRYSGVPFVAECFDPIITTEWKRSRVSYKWNAWMEKIISLNAKAVIWYTQGALNEARFRYSRLMEVGHLVRPGMSPPDFSNVSYEKGKKLRFCYFGGLSKERSLSDFIEALKLILIDNPDLAKIIEVHTFGGKLDELTQLASQNLPSGVLKKHGRLEHDQSSGRSGRQRVLEEMRKADFLILIHGAGEICSLYIPSKTYEYIWARRPIIALSPYSDEFRELLDEREHLIVDKSNQNEIKDAILESVSKWTRSQCPDCEFTKPFSSKDATEQIIQISCS